MNKLILFLLILLILPSVKALENNTFEPDDIVNYFVYCVYLNNSACNNDVSCEITAFNPDTSSLVNQGKMSFNGSGFYNYSFGVLTTQGKYSTLIHCNNTQEGVTSSFFTVGIEETVYDNHFWFYIFMYLIPVILIILSKITEDKWFSVFAGIILVCFGVYLSTNGLPYFDNELIETALWIITLCFGLYFMMKNAIDLVEEAGL